MSTVSTPSGLDGTLAGIGVIDAKGNWDGECPELWDCIDNGGTNCEVDTDGDTIIDVCDSCPNDANPEQQVSDEDDNDGDGVPNACDQCISGNDMVNLDGDICPDACDPCPGSFGYGPFEGLGDTTCGDFDLDGVCNTEEVCWFIKDDQFSSNLHSEVEHTPARIWPDKCDPVPVPAVKLGEARDGASTAGTCGPFSVIRQIFQDEIKIRALASHTSPEEVDILLPLPTTTPVLAETHYRFCQDEPLMPCITSAPYADSELHPEYTILPQDEAGDRWHRITINGLGYAGTRLLNYDDMTERTEVWNYFADWMQWGPPNNIIMLPGPESLGGLTLGDESGLKGMFWAHADTSVGELEHGLFLANSYLPLDPEYLQCFARGLGSQIQGQGFELPPWFPDFDTGDPPPFFDPTWQFGDRGLLLPLAGGGWGVTGRIDMTPVDSLIGPNLLASMNDTTLVWAHAVEASTPRSAFPVSSVALSADGTSLVQVMVSTRDGQGLFGVGDDVPDELGTMSIESLGEQPPPAEDFGASYSQTLTSVYRLGGKDPSSHELLGSMWRAGIPGDARWDKLNLSVPVGKVLANAVSFRTRKLYVLDEVHTSNPPFVRLLRYDAYAGGGEVLAQWKRKRMWDVASLRLDPHGNLVLVLSDNALGGRSWLVRLDILDSGALQPAVIYTEKRELLVPTLVDRNGFTFVLKGHGQVPEITRRECLPRTGVILGRSDAWTCPGNGGGQEPDGWEALGEVF